MEDLGLGLGLVLKEGGELETGRMGGSVAGEEDGPRVSFLPQYIFG